MQEQTTETPGGVFTPQLPRDEFMDRIRDALGVERKLTVDNVIAIATLQVMLDIRDRLPRPVTA